MPKTEPWSDYHGPSTPIWELFDERYNRLRERIREDYEERAAIMTFCSTATVGTAGTAELFAYAFLVERLWDANLIHSTMITKSNIVTQLGRARQIRKNSELRASLGLQP